MKNPSAFQPSFPQVKTAGFRRCHGMNRVLKPGLITLLALGLASPVSAAIIWTGAAGDLQVFNDANWTLNPSVPEVNPGSPVNDDLIIDTAGTITATAAGAFRLEIGDGKTITLTDSTLITTNSGSLSGLQADPASESYAVLVNSTLNVQALANGIFVSLDGNSHLILRGGGNVINSQTGPSRVNLVEGARITLSDLANLVDEIDGNVGPGGVPVGAQITVNGVDLTTSNYTEYLTITNNGDGTITAAATAVPEASTATLALLTTAMLLRRRR